MKTLILQVQTSEGSDQLAVISLQFSVNIDNRSLITDYCLPMTDYCSLITPSRLR
jgi:hypothetical protein